MNPMNIVLGMTAMVALVFLVLAAAVDYSYRVGYKRGCRDTDNWWIGVEAETDKVRQRIWREEAQR